MDLILAVTRRTELSKLQLSPDDCAELLQSGFILCDFIDKLSPGIIQKIADSKRTDFQLLDPLFSSSIDLRKNENNLSIFKVPGRIHLTPISEKNYIRLYLDACEQLDIPKCDRLNEDDLRASDSKQKVSPKVINNINSIFRKFRKKSPRNRWKRIDKIVPFVVIFSLVLVKIYLLVFFVVLC